MHCTWKYNNESRYECATHGCPECQANVAKEKRLRTEGAKAATARLVAVIREQAGRASQAECYALNELADAIERGDYDEPTQ